VIGKDKNASTLTSFTYTYNVSAQDTQDRQTTVENDAVANNTYGYTYDALNRVTAASVTAGTGTSYSYSYDSNGNRTSQTAGGTTTSYAYNAANELCWAYTGSSSNACSTAPTGAVTYTRQRQRDGVLFLRFSELQLPVGDRRRASGQLPPQVGRPPSRLLSWGSKIPESLINAALQDGTLTRGLDRMKAPYDDGSLAG